MKCLKALFGALAIIFVTFSAHAQDIYHKTTAEKTCNTATETVSVDLQTQSPSVASRTHDQNETFKVYGACGMCKRRIEGALKEVEGLHKAEWDIETKMLTVSFDSRLITLDDIHKKVAAVGHDTDKFRAEDDVYAKLHGCCKYERPQN